MPAIGFKYPNGETITFKDCFDSKKVDLIKMGCTMPMLRALSEQRDPERRPSTTELLNGTCESYLKRVIDYYIDPQECAFRLSGTMHHERLESYGGELEVESRLEGYSITGITDLYDAESKTLIDYKNCGSYKIAQVLGMGFYLGDSPTGEVYKRNGKWGKKGDIKKVKIFYEDEENADYGDWLWQLNFYRHLLEKSGKAVDKIYVQATIRDGGLQVSRERGVTKNLYLIEIPKISDDILLCKFLPKRNALVEALEKSELPEKCSDEETWGGMKCERFCEVRQLCPYMKEE